jgi:hypothetical protein
MDSIGRIEPRKRKGWSEEGEKKRGDTERERLVCVLDFVAKPYFEKDILLANTKSKEKVFSLNRFPNRFS